MIVLAGLMPYFAFLAAYHETELPWRAFKGAVGAFAAWGSWHFATGSYNKIAIPGKKAPQRWAFFTHHSSPE